MRRVRRLFRIGSVRPGIERDLEEELDFHFGKAVSALVEEGMDPDEARREADRRFGDRRRYRRALERIALRAARTTRRRERMDAMRQALGFSMRGLRRSPGFAAAVIVTLALGIGANAVMFGVVDRLLLSPPQHVAHADGVRHVYVRRPGIGGALHASRWLTFPDYADLMAVDAFRAVAAYSPGTDVTLGRGEAAERIRHVKASASLFTLLGVRPALGRFFGPDEDRIGSEPTAVLAHEFWERRFGADPDILGRTLDIGRGEYTVVGVAPSGFTGAELAPVDVWLPLETAQAVETGIEGGQGWRDDPGGRKWWWLHVVARLAPATADEVAIAEATAAHRSGRRTLIEAGDYDAEAEILTASVIAARGPTPSNEAQVARWLAGVALAVLLIACANVANLLLARAVRWRRELAVRVALGVGRARLLGQLLTESLVLAGMGGATALALARWGGAAVHRVLLPNVAFHDAGPGGRLLVFTILATLATGTLAGLVPSLQASRPDVAGALRTGGRGGSLQRSGARTWFLVLQATLSVVLLVGAGLFVKSLQQARALDLGFDARRTALVQLHWNGDLTGTQRETVYRLAAARVRRIPGTRAAGLSYSVPFWSSFSIGRPRIPGQDSFPPHPAGGPYANKVGPGYFEALGLSILRGRPIRELDDEAAAAPVAVVSESMARAGWPEGDALGGCMILGRAGEDGTDPPCTDVVGVVEDHRRGELVEESPHHLYFLNQDHPAFLGPPQALMVGTAGPAAGRVEDIRAELRDLGSEVRFVEVRSLQSLVDPSLRSWRLGATMFAVFGLLALLVAAVGLYSVLAFDVARRKHELGVRSALGAGRSRLVRLVAGRAMVPVGLGVAAGLLIALAGSGLVEPLLFRVAPRDPAVYAGVAVSLLAVAALAGLLPARRATRVDPAEPLRAE